MLLYLHPLNVLKLIILSFALTGLSFYATAETKAATPVLEVYKDANCGCCNEWITHAEHRGFSTKAHNISQLRAFKLSHGISDENQSCHTAISTDGYIFEGHVPARFIHAFLQSPPADAIGLAVPAMPVGSPGMEYQNKFDPYDVLLLMKDGSSKVYAQITSLEESVK